MRNIQVRPVMAIPFISDSFGSQRLAAGSGVAMCPGPLPDPGSHSVEMAGDWRLLDDAPSWWPYRLDRAAIVMDSVDVPFLPVAGEMYWDCDPLGR
jgi:hypothetical protein